MIATGREMMRDITTHSPEETIAFGRTLAELLALRTRMTNTIEELEQRLAASHQASPNRTKHRSLKAGVA